MGVSACFEMYRDTTKLLTEGSLRDIINTTYFINTADFMLLNSRNC